MHKDVAITLDPSHACECGLEDQPGKEDTTQITIAVLMVRRVDVLTDLLDIVKNPGCKGALRQNAYACRI